MVRDADVVALARRDAEQTEEHGSQRIEDTGIEVIDLDGLRAAGVEAAMRRALERLAAPGLDGFWIHLDADALDDAIMPAVDYRLPDGLGWDEMTPILRAAMRSSRALGIDVTIFNPKLDPDRAIAKRFVRAICDGLTNDQAASG